MERNTAKETMGAESSTGGGVSAAEEAESVDLCSSFNSLIVSENTVMMVPFTREGFHSSLVMLLSFSIKLVKLLKVPQRCARCTYAPKAVAKRKEWNNIKQP